MLALPGILGLVICLYLRPQDFVPGLAGWELLHVSLAVALVGLCFDIAVRSTRLTRTPQLPWAALFTAWCLLGLGWRQPDAFLTQAPRILVPVTIYLVVAHGIPRVRTFVTVVRIVFAIGLFVAYVGVDQGMSPFQCLMVNPVDLAGQAYPDGRLCFPAGPDGPAHDGDLQCVESGQPGVMYRCERAGMLGTSSIYSGRVRYLGVLQDPNDLALATAMALPFAFAFLEIRRSVLRVGLVVVTAIVVGTEIVLTQSRGGQLTYGAVLGAYFIKKYGWARGLFVGAAMIVPIALLGGRSDEGAEGSTIERLGCACAGIKMFRAYPITGVGFAWFTHEHPLTAHNAYILAAAELGLVGMSLFAFVLYLSIKIPVLALRLDMGAGAEARIMKALAMAMLAALGGAGVGIFFLSWTYHYVLWIHFGLSGALYLVVRARHPTFECRLTFKEAASIVVGYLAFLVFWTGYIKLRGAWE